MATITGGVSNESPGNLQKRNLQQWNERYPRARSPTQPTLSWKSDANESITSIGGLSGKLVLSYLFPNLLSPIAVVLNLQRNNFFQDASSISIRMIRSAPFSVATMAVLNRIGCTSLQVYLRLRGAGFRRYSAKAGHFNNNHNRHWYRHLIVAYSPILIPLLLIKGFPEEEGSKQRDRRGNSVVTEVDYRTGERSNPTSPNALNKPNVSFSRKAKTQSNCCLRRFSAGRASRIRGYGIRTLAGPISETFTKILNKELTE